MNQFKKRRTHFTYVFRNLLSMMWIIVVSGLSVFSEFSSDHIIDDAAQVTEDVMSYFGGALLAFLGVCAVVVLISILQWRKLFIYAEEDNLVVEKGVLFHKKLVLPFEKINTVDIRRGIIQRLIGTCTLKIDSGSLAARTNAVPEISLIFSLEDAQEIRAFILNRNAADEQLLREDKGAHIDMQEGSGPRIKAHFMDFFLYGLTQAKLAGLLSAVFVIIPVIVAIILPEENSQIDFLFERISSSDIWAVGPILILLLALLLLVVAFYVITTVFSILTSCIAYYNFNARREGDNIIVEYGLLQLKSFTLPVRNIHAVITRQNFLRQITGYCTVEVVSIGYGDEENEIALLFPLIKMKRLNELLSQVLPEYVVEAEYSKPVLASLYWFTAHPALLWVLFLGVPIIVCAQFFGGWVLNFLWLFAAVLPACLTVGLMRYRSNGLSYNTRSISVRMGGFTRTITHMRTDSVQSVETYASVWRRRCGIVNYHVDYHAPLLKSSVRVTNLSDKYMHTISALIEDEI